MVYHLQSGLIKRAQVQNLLTTPASWSRFLKYGPD